MGKNIEKTGKEEEEERNKRRERKSPSQAIAYSLCLTRTPGDNVKTLVEYTRHN